MQTMETTQIAESGPVVETQKPNSNQAGQLLSQKGGASDLAFDGELQVQPEQATDWSKVLKEMKQRGIRALGEDGEADPEGETVAEADVQAAWERVAPLAPLPEPESHPSAAKPTLSELSRSHDIQRPHSHEQSPLF
ncbi:hypothetical protein BH20ACT11_BH20ACT11_13670 [soil metagenome]